VVVGGLFVAPGAALADEPEVQITNLQTEVLSGGNVTLQYQVRIAADDNGPQEQTAEIGVGGDMRCVGGECGRVTQISRNGGPFTATLKAPDVGAGETRRVRVEVFGSIDGDRRTVDQTITVRGQDRPETVRQLSGKVKDQDGKAVSGAAVAMQDSQGNRYQSTSNGSGGFSFTSSEGEPIAPGTIQVGAGKDGFKAAQVQVQAAAGRSVTVSLTLKSEAATESASPSASASASATAEPTEDAASEPVGEDTPAAGGGQDNAANSEDSGSSLIYFLLGGLLVAAGIGAMVLVFLRRRNAADNGGDDDDPTGMGGGGGVVPPSHGRFNDATRVAAPVGAGAAAATMVAPRSGAPSMADAPTMLHRPVPPVEDEFPDPYGAPIPQQGGYIGTGAAAGGWDDQPGYGGTGNAYGAPTQYGRAVDDGYGQPDSYGAAPAAGYGDEGGYGAAPAEPQRRYDEPTGMYQPTPEAGGYDDYDRGGYGAAQQQPHYGGYAEPEPPAAPAAGTYGGGWGTPADGIDNSGNAYGPQGGGTYGAAPAAGGQYGGGQQYDGGYGDANGGYADDRGGYGDQGQGVYGGAAPAAGTYGGGYDQQQPAGGYDEPQYDENGYDQQRGTYGAPRQEPPAPGQRRSNDWGN
jgi:hypothetical protein